MLPEAKKNVSPAPRQTPPPPDFARYQPHALEVELRPAPAAARLTLWLMAAFLAFAAGWACLAKVDRVVTAQGRIISPETNLVVQPMEASIIREVYVSVGQRVETGQPLAALDPTFAEAGAAELEKRAASLTAQAWRLEAEIGEPPGDAGASGRKAAAPVAAKLPPPPQGVPEAEMEAQRALFLKRREEHHARAASLERTAAEIEARRRTNSTAAEQARKQIALAKNLEDMYRDVFEKGASSRLEYMKAQSARIEAETRLAQLGAEAGELAEALGRARAEREGFVTAWRAAAMKELVETRRELDQIAERARKAGRLRELVTLKAPKDGVVLEIVKKSAGSVVGAGEPVVTLAPANAGLEAEAEVKASDIGFIREGDPARIKLDAFPFQRHGTLDGRVRLVNPDAFEKQTPEGVQLCYRLRVNVERADLRAVPRDFRLMLGMGLTAEIRVGERRVIAYLLYPLIRSFDETMREP
jgi:HlyD family type I secretion membrane fusion protein